VAGVKQGFNVFVGQSAAVENAFRITRSSARMSRTRPTRSA
jgi:hypothetical protein